MGALEFFTWYFLIGILSTIIWYGIAIRNLFKGYKRGDYVEGDIQNLFTDDEFIMLVFGIIVWWIVYPLRIGDAIISAVKARTKNFDKWLGEKIKAHHRKKNPEEYV